MATSVTVLDDPIVIEAGATLRNARFQYCTQAREGAAIVPVDLTGCTIAGDVRPSVESADLYFSFDTADGSIVLDDQPAVSSDGLSGTGWFELVMSATTTSAQTWRKGMMQVEITFADGSKDRAFEVQLRVLPESTR